LKCVFAASFRSRLGIIKSYCDCDVENGISLLKVASQQGYVRASYALGLVLRDTAPEDAFHYMSLAADQEYLPALQELLPARDMKVKYGEPNASELRHYLDHLCLNRLLSRNYLLSSNFRCVNTSHCWNHLCGRWAYKASTAASNEMDGNPIRSALRYNRNSIDVAGITMATVGRSSSTESSTDTTTGSESQQNRVSRMKMCSRCCRAKYCSKLCQVYDWRSGRHKMECHFL
jgi:MYND finger